MNTTPRVLNRFVLAVIGSVLLVAGAAGLALLTVPAAAAWWGATTPRLGAGIEDVRSRTTLEGQSDTWLWIALAGVLTVLILLTVLWIAAQGRGRTGLFASPGDSDRGRAAPRHDGGTVTITAAAAEQVLKAALLERSDLAGVSVSTWRIRGVPSLRVRVSPRKGVPPYTVAAEVSRLVEALDAVTGYRTPVLISISTGARARLARSDRVD